MLLVKATPLTMRKLLEGLSEPLLFPREWINDIKLLLRHAQLLKGIPSEDCASGYHSTSAIHLLDQRNTSALCGEGVLSDTGGKHVRKQT